MTYTTAAEYRAHLAGAGEVIKAIQAEIGPLWIMGRDGMDLEYLRDFLLRLNVGLIEHLRAAQQIEAADRQAKEQTP